VNASVSDPKIDKYWQKVFWQAWADTRQSFGLNQKTAASGLVAIVGLFIVYFSTGSAMNDGLKLLWYALSVLVAGLLLFCWNFVNAQAAICSKLALASTEEKTNEQVPTYVSDINIAAGLTPQTIHPVLLIGKSAFAGPRLRIVLEHSHYSSGMGWGCWTDRTQIELSDMRDVIAGQQINVPVVSCATSLETSANLMWGRASGPPVTAVQRGKQYRARIRFIGDNAYEQRPIYFILIRTSEEEPPYFVHVITENDFAFVREWGSGGLV
jgi:hypothetical protein